MFTGKYKINSLRANEALKLFIFILVIYRLSSKEQSILEKFGNTHLFFTHQLKNTAKQFSFFLVLIFLDQINRFPDDPVFFFSADAPRNTSS